MGRFLFKPAPVTSVAIQGRDEAFPVRRVYCIGKNYAAHVVEMGSDPARSAPFFFAKPTDAVDCLPAEVPFPGATANLHHEVELVVALGDSASGGPAVCGFAVGVDLTRRDLQSEAKKKGQPWVTSKSFDHSAPVSDLRLMSLAALDPAARIRLAVNDETRQDGTLGEMIWSVPELLSNLANFFALQPGDLVFTGTPAGVGPLTHGDRVHAGIDGIATLEFTIR